MYKGKIGVAVISFDRPGYLNECLKSIQDQVDNNFEVHVFQDDAILIPGFMKYINETIENLPKDSEMVNIGFHKFASGSKFVRWDFNEDFKVWDELFLNSYYRFAKSKNKQSEALNYYTQQKNIIEIYQELIAAKNKTITGINGLHGKSDVTQLMINNLTEDVIRYMKQVNDKIAVLDTAIFVPLPNIDTIEELKEAIVEGGEISNENGPIFENGGIGRIMAAVENAIANCNRVENKNIDQILSFHKSLMDDK
jgi:hypothetical protein